MKQYTVKAILKENNITVGARVSDGNQEVNMKTEKLIIAYRKGVKFENAVLTSEGFVKAKSGNLPIIELNNNKLILYHGSIEGLRGTPKVNYSNKPCDFGGAFYLGDNEMQAINRVCNHSDSYLYKVELDIDEAKVYTFKDDTLWALYIGVNRGILDAKNYPKLRQVLNSINSHDLITGLIADDKIAKSYTQFMEGSITDKALSECLKEVRLGNQYAIKNQKLCRKGKFKIVNSQKLSVEDRNTALEWGKGVKENIDNRLKEVKIKYRRVGKYIDEILKEYE